MHVAGIRPEMDSRMAARSGADITAGLLSRLVDDAPAAIAVVRGRRHCFVYANAAFRALMPRGGRRVVGRPAAEVLLPAAAARCLPVLADVLQTGRSMRLRAFSVPSASGELRYFDTNLIPLAGADGIDAIAIMANDVTARIHAQHRAERLTEEAVRRAREAEEARLMLDALMAYVPQGIAVVDTPDMRVRRMSYHGMSMTSRPWQSVLHGEPGRIDASWQLYRSDARTPPSAAESPLARAAQHGEVVTNEEWLLRRHDGALVPVLCNAGPIRDARGRITGAVLSWHDISSLEESRRRTEEAAERLELAVEAGRMGLCDFDLRGGSAVCSDGLRTILGLPAGQTPSLDSFLASVEEPDRGKARAAISAALRAESGAFGFEARAVRPGGEPVWLDVRGRVFFDRACHPPQPVRIVCSVRDDTERVRMAAEAAALLAQKDLLLREVHHRVNNSLQLIISLLRLQTLQQPPELRRQLDETMARVRTVAQVHKRLYQTDRLKTVEISAYLRELCSDLAKSLGHAFDGRLRLSSTVADVPIETAVSLGLIVNELVTNAFKHAYACGAADPVEVAFVERGGAFVLTVADRGRGLPPGFDPQASAGLGMRVVRSLVERLHGEFAARQAEPGARFEIRFAARR